MRLEKKKNMATNVFSEHAVPSGGRRTDHERRSRSPRLAQEERAYLRDGKARGSQDCKQRRDEGPASIGPAISGLPANVIQRREKGLKLGELLPVGDLDCFTDHAC